MKGFILAAGLGTRLKPWTDHHPKALVPVGGIPMLKRIVEKMHASDIRDITVNIYHFADQIKDYIKENGWDIKISDERPELLETGGGLLKASSFLKGEEDILVHNVDILSNVDIHALIKQHKEKKAKATLLVSERDSSRKLVFDAGMNLRGWHSLNDGNFKPISYKHEELHIEFAFSGIYVLSPDLLKDMEKEGWKGRFSIMDFFLQTLDKHRYVGYEQENLEITDIGKPETLVRANNSF